MKESLLPTRSDPAPLVDVSAGPFALCLTGGGAAGAMFQIGALAALEDRIQDWQGHALDLYVGNSSGASVAAALAGGKLVQRIYRAFLDPADDYFPLERRHILQTDLSEWRRTASSALRALRHGSRSVLRTVDRPSPAVLWEELSRLYDSLPAGLFSLDGYERFLEENFVRRGVPNQFRAMPRPLRIIAHELDTGDVAVFGDPGLEHVPVTRACIASMAMPPLFTPVRIGNLHYIDPAPAQLSPVDQAVRMGARVILVVNPLVPLRVGTVPTGHGPKSSLRDKGAMWVGNQANRIKLHHLLWESIERVRAQRSAEVVVIEPEGTDGTLFMHNAASFAARRAILEFAYLYTRKLISRWGDEDKLGRLGWKLRLETD